MKIEQQVCTRIQAERLKELGVEQLSAFCYMAYDSQFKGDEQPVHNNFYKADPSAFLWCSAFTVSELGVLFPINPSKDGNYNWYHRHNHRGHSVGYSCFGLEPIEQLWFSSEAEARAAMLIYLLENNLTTAGECNARLAA